MSVFMSPVAQFPIQPQRNDESAQWQYDSEESWNQMPWSWTDPLWPRSRWPSLPSGAAMGTMSDVISVAYTNWWWAHRVGGAQERWQMFGQTLDQNSNVVANATVYMFDQTLGVRVDTQTSDGGGNYLISSPYGAGRSFAYAQKAGSPDTAGASDNNLP